MQRQPESGEILFGISKAIHEKMLQCQKLQKARNDLHAERKVDVDASLCSRLRPQHLSEVVVSLLGQLSNKENR